MTIEQAIIDNTQALREVMLQMQALGRAFETHTIRSLDLTVLGKDEDPLPAFVDTTVLAKCWKDPLLTPVVVEVVTAKKFAAAPLPREIGAALPAMPQSSALTAADVGRALTEAAKVNRDRVIGILADFGVKRGSELTPDQYADFIAAVAV